MEWECDVDDPFEQALAKRYRQTTAKAESQVCQGKNEISDLVIAMNPRKNLIAWVLSHICSI